MSKAKCIHTLNEIRGFCVLCMVLDHCIYTLGYMFGHSFCEDFFDVLSYISPAFATAFILISGISSQLSRNNIRRGLRILAASMFITFGSMVIMPDMPIMFGILHLLGVCALLFVPLKRLIDKIPTAVGITVCALLFILTYRIEDRYLGIGDFTLQLPYSLYKEGYLMFLGFRSPYSSYSDYFPLLPWAFAFFAGTFIGKLARDGRFPKGMYKPHVPFFSLLGTNAFFVYLIHQPLIYILYYLMSLPGWV